VAAEHQRREYYNKNVYAFYKVFIYIFDEIYKKSEVKI